MTANNISQLDSLQMKYLKWMLHTPRGTCNSFTLLELGLLPMRHEINLRKLAFLYHILNLDDDDPVKQVYREEQRLVFEPNWANEVKQLIEDLNLPNNEMDIRSKTKLQWKNLTRSAVTNKALDELNNDCLSKKKTAGVPRYDYLEKLSYFNSLHPHEARVLFKIRAFVSDIKANRSYFYEDETCRLCGGEREDTLHILNDCAQVDKSNDLLITNLHDLAEENTREILYRFDSFQTQVAEMET